MINGYINTVIVCNCRHSHGHYLTDFSDKCAAYGCGKFCTKLGIQEQILVKKIENLKIDDLVIRYNDFLPKKNIAKIIFKSYGDNKSWIKLTFEYSGFEDSSVFCKTGEFKKTDYMGIIESYTNPKNNPLILGLQNV